MPIDIDRQAERQQRQQVTILINKPVGYVSVGRTVMSRRGAGATAKPLE
jgi:16S rRNA U516 pseudouridylate synthase RsuA-like enzyme